MATYFLEIIDLNHIAEGDIEIITPASYDAPGQARVLAARVTDPPTDAPNARRLVSHNGSGLIGIIATEEFMLPPYNFAYWLLKEAANG